MPSLTLNNGEVNREARGYGKIRVASFALQMACAVTEMCGWVWLYCKITIMGTRTAFQGDSGPERCYMKK